MSRRNLAVEVPGDEPSPRTPEDSGALEVDGSAPSSTIMGKIMTPGAVVSRAIATGVRTVVSPFTSKNSDKKPPPSRRVSVNPLARAANDVVYRHSLEMTDKQMQEFASFRKIQPSAKSSKGLGQVIMQPDLLFAGSLAAVALQSGWEGCIIFLTNFFDKACTHFCD